MANPAVMDAKDAISASLAQCYMIIDKRRYNFMSLISFEATFTKTKKEVSILGRAGKAHKSTGWSGSFSGKAHYNQTIIRKMMEKFKDSGADAYFTIEVTNEDPASSIGRQTVQLLDCNLDGGTLVKFDASADTLEEDLSGTFDDFKILEAFKPLAGM